MFQLLALFPSARVDDVEEVAAGLERLAGVDVLACLSSLVDKSLARSLEDEGQQRLSMLGTIRDFAAERLRTDLEFHAAARRAHAEHFAELAAQDRASSTRWRRSSATSRRHGGTSPRRASPHG